MEITINTTNIQDGTNLPYTIFGTQLNEEDIVQDTEGTVLIQNGIGTFTLSIDCDRISGTTDGTVTFAIPDFGSSATIILDKNSDADTDTSTGDDGDLFDGDATDDELNDRDGFDGDGEVVFGQPIIDEDGGIIDIPVVDSGHRFLATPFMSVESNTGFGAFVEPILNSNGYLTRVRVRRGGQGYTGQRQPDDVICQLVGITLTNVGGLYDRPPQVFVDGNSSIAEATISPEGFVNGIVLLKVIDSMMKYLTSLLLVAGDSVLKQRLDLQCVPEDQSQLILAESR